MSIPALFIWYCFYRTYVRDVLEALFIHAVWSNGCTQLQNEVWRQRSVGRSAIHHHRGTQWIAWLILCRAAHVHEGSAVGLVNVDYSQVYWGIRGNRSTHANKCRKSMQNSFIGLRMSFEVKLIIIFACLLKNEHSLLTCYHLFKPFQVIYHLSANTESKY